MQKALKFNPNNQTDFVNTLKSRVDSYFTETGKDRFGNRELTIKTIFILALYFVPWMLIIFNVFDTLLPILGLWLLMGSGMAGGGLNIMHDANHGAFSRNHRTNHYMGLISNFFGVSHINWKIQHNVLHHTFTNIEGHDDSLHGGKIFRFSPHQKVLPWHRYQHLYAWPFYTLQTIVWAISTDFVRLKKYRDMGLLKPYKKSYDKLKQELILWKIGYFGLFLIIPMVFSALPWWQTLLCFITMQLAVGFFLTLVFITAHIMPECQYPLPDSNGTIENAWAVHQLQTSCNFATGSRWFSWYLGGLNYQAEHHLFPNICHVHYPAISKILKETATEFKLPYYHIKTFGGAIKTHAGMMKHLGNPNSVIPSLVSL